MGLSFFGVFKFFSLTIILLCGYHNIRMDNITKDEREQNQADPTAGEIFANQDGSDYQGAIGVPPENNPLREQYQEGQQTAANVSGAFPNYQSPDLSTVESGGESPPPHRGRRWMRVCTGFSNRTVSAAERKK